MKSFLVLATLSAAMLSFSAYSDDKTPDADAAGDPVILKVNGDGIKKSEVDQAWKMIFEGREVPPMDSMGEKVKDRFLRELASEHVLLQEAHKEGVENSPEVKTALEKIKRQIVIQQLLRDKTKNAVSDDKLKADYEMHLKDSATSGGQEYHARHILVKTKAEAEAIEKKLKGGEGFEQIAKEQSQDKASGAAGGDLGWFTGDKMVPEFTAALARLKKGETSPPVKSDFGWHVIQLEDTRKTTPPSFSEVKETLKQEVGNKAVREYVKSVMADVKVTQVDAQGHETPIPEPSDTPAGAAEAPKPAAGDADGNAQ